MGASLDLTWSRLISLRLNWPQWIPNANTWKLWYWYSNTINAHLNIKLTSHYKSITKNKLTRTHANPSVPCTHLRAMPNQPVPIKIKEKLEDTMKTNVTQIIDCPARGCNLHISYVYISCSMSCIWRHNNFKITMLHVWNLNLKWNFKTLDDRNPAICGAYGGYKEGGEGRAVTPASQPW